MATHIYHYNVHAEKRYFLGREHRGLYDLIGLNGNIVSHTPAGVAAFVSTANKPFYIDPQTHAFQHATSHLKKDISDKESREPPNYVFKPSIEKLASLRLGAPFAGVVEEDKPLTPAAFLDEGTPRAAVIDAVSEHVADFQLHVLESELDEEAKELMEGATEFKPEFLLAPYFYLSPKQWSNWLKISIACYERTRALHGKETPVYMPLVLSQSALAHRQAIADAIESVAPDGILLWIDDHVEQELRKADIVTYVELLQMLRQKTETILTSHGGYLSTLLSHPETGPLLNGVGHSVNYGEHREVVPIGGGLPMARFYLLAVHARLRYADAAGMLLATDWLKTEDKYRNKVCACRQCEDLIRQCSSPEMAFFEYGRSRPITSARRSGTIVQLDYPTKEAKQAAAWHYLYCKAHEMESLGQKTLAQLLEELSSSSEEIASSAGEDGLGHLQTWHDALLPLVG